MEAINLAQKFALFQEYWSPKIVGELNDSYVKIVKLKGELTTLNTGNVQDERTVNEPERL